MNYGIHKAFPGQIHNMAVMDSTHHSRFKAWQSNAGHGGATRRYTYTFQVGREGRRGGREGGGWG